MEEKFSNWLLDIAKYVLTVLILASVFRDTADAVNGWLFYGVSLLFVAVVVLLGVHLHFVAERKRKKREEQANQPSNS